jgi:hypothetical protein
VPVLGSGVLRLGLVLVLGFGVLVLVFGFDTRSFSA